MKEEKPKHVQDRLDLLKKATANGGMVPLDLTEEEKQLAEEMREEGLFSASTGIGNSYNFRPLRGDRNQLAGRSEPEIPKSPSPDDYDSLVDIIEEAQAAGRPVAWHDWYEDKHDELPLPEEMKQILDTMNPDEAKVVAALFGVAETGERSPRGAQPPAEVAEELGISIEEVDRLGKSGLISMNPKGAAQIGAWPNRSDYDKSTYGLRSFKEGLAERLFHYDIRDVTIGSDPATMKTPMEVDDWVGAIVEWQAMLVRHLRSQEGRTHLETFMRIQEPVEALKEIKTASNIGPRGLPRNIEKRFQRLALQSAKGELHGTTKRMVEAAEARVGDYDYAWLQTQELPAESGLVVIPEGAWELDYFNAETDDGYRGAGSVAALSWTCVAGGVMVCFWDEVEHGTTFSVDIHHTWFCDVSVGGHSSGPLLHPMASDYGDKFKELKLESVEEEWDAAKEALTESWLMIAKGSELIRMLGEEITFAQRRRPHFQDKATKRKAKRVLEEIPDILIYDLRRYTSNPTGPHDGEGIPREYTHSFDVRGHPRTLDRGTADERIIWIPSYRKAKDKPYIKKDRIGVLRR
jgi:hypothetical protein